MPITATQMICQSATQLLMAIRAKRVSSEELVKALYAHIETVNGRINALVQSDPEKAIRQAREADSQWAKGHSLGKLHGLPVTIKDVCAVKGFVCTEGTLGLKNNVAQTNATCVARLCKEGAIILGLTNAPEAATCYESDNLIYGRTNNPYDLECTPGGSSGGEAALIAIGGSPLGLGTDGAGSVRLPAHFCGIAGLKPTTHRIPLTGLLIPKDGIGMVNKVSAFGPLARHVEDLALVLSILSGPDGIDPHIVPMPLGDPYKVDVSKLRVAFFTDNGIVTPSSDIMHVVQNAANKLAKQGCRVDEVSPRGLERTYELLWGIFFEGGDGNKGLIESLHSMGTQEFSPLLQHFLKAAKEHEVSLTQYHSLIEECDTYSFQMYQLFQPYDVIVSPACATAAKPHGISFDTIRDFTYTMTYNIMGWPAAVVRCGTTSEGLPIGIQIAAHAWKEDHVLAVAKVLEEVFGGWHYPENF